MCSESAEALTDCQDVIQQLVKCLADQDLDIAKVARDVLVTLGNVCNVRKTIFRVI